MSPFRLRAQARVLCAFTLQGWCILRGRETAMRTALAGWGILLLLAPGAQAHGLLIPKERSIPPLAMLRHEVTIAIEDQAAVTKVEQVFRNHTKQDLEATYIFPVPKGASVNKFSMWLDGKEVKGELVEANAARSLYTEAVKRT